ncbi:putative polyglutamate biosynthesis protein [Neohortaea acidophila]|uniref:Putative polyglutamate biosynthesis protein n=1 Tax=Neohortaea acidophila TaxID=245834 RepID=A0A6A6Q382_9PEZI|nr:putative polyglutamate biosynthesis protein [Neohortaea acidophila]KAF2486469.1 putative polyglutamate biosynthesis protein [Neohortaea acidophila]
MLRRARKMAPQTFILNFMGDTMLGRLIDQMFPQHVDEPDEARIVRSFRSSNYVLPTYDPTSPWGDTLPLLHSADLNLLNLETSVTTHPTKWPDKVFNYRMHPANISALEAARIDHAGLANNHTLDFCEPGLLETVRTVRKAGIACAGAGESEEEACSPAVLRLPSSRGDGKFHEIHIWAAADHPDDWSAISTFHFIDYSAKTRSRLKKLLTSSPSSNNSPALKIFSVHWGPNYSWQPAQEIRDLAHYLIDECRIDIVHGHSSHHVQGVERYKGKLIIYGCGDFVDDYAVKPDYRNDLSGVWQITVAEGDASGDGQVKEGLELRKLEMYPTAIRRFQVWRLDADEEDAEWVRERIRDLSAELGTRVIVDNERGTVRLDFGSTT